MENNIDILKNLKLYINLSLSLKKGEKVFPSIWRRKKSD